jgi:acyl-CoA synthetase (AMP-forming)/AMP-acid ligase II
MKGPPLPPPRHDTLPRALAAAARTDLGLTFVGAGEAETFLPYAALERSARRLAHGLGRLGVRRGDRVALVLPTAAAFPIAFFGVLLAGATPVPLAPPLRLGRLDEFHVRTARCLAVAACRLALADAPIARLLGVAIERARPDLGLRTVDELLALARDEGALPARPDDLALVQFSSGATVDPKPAALAHRAVLANVAALGRPAAPSGKKRVVGSTDMGNVSKVVPSIHPMIRVAPPGVPIHSHDFATHARSAAGDEAVVLGAKAMAMTIADLWADPAAVDRAKAELASARG